jgi:signal transduction histidine kinase
MIKSFWKNLLWRAWEIIGSVNVRVKIMGIVIGGTLLLSMALALQIRASVTRLMEQQLESQGISIARDLAARATDDILVNDLYALRQLLLETQNNNQDVIYAFVLDPQGKVLVNTFGEGFPAGLAAMNSVNATQHHSIVLLDTPQGLVWDVAVPIFDGRAGTARVGLSGAIINQVVLSITSQMLITMVFVLALSLLAAASLTFVLTRPILELVAATRVIAKGDFTPRVRRWADDEIGELAEAFNAMSAELARADEIRREREVLRRQLLEGVIAAQEEERRRIARELHDSTSQSLTSLMVGLKTLDTLCDHPQVHSHARDLRNITGQVLQDVHEIAFQLRPAALDDLGLPAAIERLTQEWQKRYQILTDVTVHLGDERLPDNVETALYRIVQEALTNVARHAGARFVSVLVERRTQEVIAVIEDDGKGMHPTRLPAGRLGVAGMRERAELIGGKLTIESAAGAGTSLFIQIPIPQPEGAHS